MRRARREDNAMGLALSTQRPRSGQGGAQSGWLQPNPALSRPSLPTSSSECASKRAQCNSSISTLVQKPRGASERSLAEQTGGGTAGDVTGEEECVCAEPVEPDWSFCAKETGVIDRRQTALFGTGGNPAAPSPSLPAKSAEGSMQPCLA
ncbi:hypothetical protein BU23DRAFT_569979 [Bimuria novae-zelandiae CBS 107.79]|uniref:Uncharacterized protein n=1 Tax=Bimuria novae-zelandiae CBS 107.79 TaxID=1447943 RepID=A0A6A5V394_9PLEO|nr:hypothetical protein BU23DRAFT_569979 [Bimuria novae-zelandiae CBS 107.79]